MNTRTLLYCILILFIGPSVSAQNPAKVTGTLTIGGKSFTLTHVRAQERPNPFDESKKIVRIVLSDVPISDRAMNDKNAMEDLILEETLHAIEFTFTPEGETFGGELYYNMMSYIFQAGTFDFEKKTFNATTVSGKVSAKEESKNSEMHFRVTATFTVPIEH
ncbi:MAG: hypothetical protein AB1728_06155 [Bacteroidota bacterium]